MVSMDPNFKNWEATASADLPRPSGESNKIILESNLSAQHSNFKAIMWCGTFNLGCCNEYDDVPWCSAGNNFQMLVRDCVSWSYMSGNQRSLREFEHFLAACEVKDLFLT